VLSATKPQPEPTRTAAAGSPHRSRAFSVAEVADRFAVKAHIILALIKANEIKAIDLRSPGSMRPRWRIMPADIEAFEQRRTAVPESTSPPKKKKAAIDLVDPATGRVRREYKQAGSVQAAKRPAKGHG
jgi:hypothetical protein